MLKGPNYPMRPVKVQSVVLPYIQVSSEKGDIGGVLGNKCAGQHNLKTVQIREIKWK